jgi:hypothetical protein
MGHILSRNRPSDKPGTIQFYERLQIVLGHSPNSLFVERPSFNRLKGSESLDHVLVILPGRLASVFAVTLDESVSEGLERHLSA